MESTNFWSQLLRPVLFLSSVILIGYVVYSGNSVSEPVVTEVKSVTSKTETVKTIKRKIETRKPDGTQVTETTVEKEIAKVKSRSTETVTSTPAKTQYRAGVKYLPSLSDAPKSTDIAVSGGARVANSNVWVEVEIDIKHRQGSVGLSLEW